MKKALTAFSFVLIFSYSTLAQMNSGLLQGTISGKVFDSEFNFPLEYATVILYTQHDSVQVSGTITDHNGNFQLIGLKPGLYYLTISFMGYLSNNVEDIIIQRGTSNLDLGEIPLKLVVVDMDEVEVTAEKLALEYKIDKKVVNVDKLYTAASGTAVDVLQNVPSVQVDIEGNVSLRGSDNFTLLIDGKPSILEAADALQQIPASSIDNIEIITNPSAKYNPEGTSGIINVIMKKNHMNGTEGIVNLNSGLEDKYGGDFLVSYKKGIVKTIFGADYSNKNFPGSSRRENYTIQNGLTSYVNSDGVSSWGRLFYGIRGGLVFDFNEHNWLSIGGRYGDRKMERDSDLEYDEWTEPLLQHNFYTSKNDRERSGDFYMINLDYRRKFSRKDHQITSMFYFSKREGEEESTSELFDEGELISGQLSTEDGPGSRIGVEIDYTLPFGEDSKFETGYHNRLHNSKDITTWSEADSTGIYIFQPSYSHSIEYQRDNHAIYGMFSDELGKFGYQIGLRGEYTYRTIKVTDQDDNFKLDRWDYFPTFHLSYQLNGGKQLMASYSRRIERPRGWYLEPFETWSDAYNVRRGNPDLKPEYIDSYEISYQTNFDRNLFSLESYYRFTDNKIERIRSAYEGYENVTLSTIDNVGTSYAYGLESMLNMKIKRWWNFNLMVDLFQYRIKGNLYANSYSNESFNWNARFNNNFLVTTSTTVQLNTSYHSPSVTSQGERKEFFTVDAAVKQELISKKLFATLQVNDIFSTSKHEFINEGPDFYSYTYFDRDAPVVMLNLTLNINDYKNGRKRNGEMEIEGEDEF